MPSSKNRHLSFTGTQGEISPERKHALLNLLAKKAMQGYKHLHHGDCINADAIAHDIWTGLGLITHVHPPINGYKRAFRKGTFMYEPRDFIPRNHDIVDAGEELVAVPKELGKEEQRSGTWATVRYARNRGKEVTFV